jgi:ferredoxin
MDAGIDLPHSCMSGSCLTCPARLSSGTVDQSEGVLEDEQTAKGLMLTCVSYPLSDLSFTVIEEADLDE